jgi:hypothetical protein
MPSTTGKKGSRQYKERLEVQVEEPPSEGGDSGLREALAWWFLGAGAKEAAWRVATCATMAFVIAPRVSPPVRGLLAFLGVSLLLGPVMIGYRNVRNHLRSRRLRQGQDEEGISRSQLGPVVVSIVVASIFVGSVVYLVGERASDRQIAAEREAFAREKAQLKEARLEASREQRRRRQAISASLRRARLGESRALTRALVPAARNQYEEWEELLATPVGSSWDGIEILRMVNKDIRNIVWASKRINTPGEGRALRGEIRFWIRGSREDRVAIAAGAQKFFPQRFVRVGGS